MLEVVTAGGEDDFVSLDALLLADQSHVHKLGLVLEFPHTIDNVGLVVGPLDAELGAGHLEEIILESNKKTCFFFTSPPASV